MCSPCDWSYSLLLVATVCMDLILADVGANSLLREKSRHSNAVSVCATPSSATLDLALLPSPPPASIIALTSSHVIRTNDVAVNGLPGFVSPATVKALNPNPPEDPGHHARAP